MTTALPLRRDEMVTPNRADAHWTVILGESATSCSNPPSPVPAMTFVTAAASAIAMFGIPESAPKDMSPRYNGEEMDSGEPPANGTLIFTEEGRWPSDDSPSLK